MWRLPASAITRDQTGAFEGIVESIELRRGERYARLKIQGAAFDIPTDDPQMKPGTPQRFAIDMNRLTVWSI